MSFLTSADMAYPLYSNSDTSIIMMGTDAYVEGSPASGYHPLTCKDNNGDLNCSNVLVPSDGLVCNVSQFFPYLIGYSR